MSKIGVCAGHYNGANVIPAQYRTRPEHNYSEGTSMHALAKRIVGAHPHIYNARTEAGTATPWHPNWTERSSRLKNAGCDYAFELHTNWSIGGGGKPNRGVFLVIVSLCFEAGANKEKACAAEKALALKLWKPLADKLGLKFEIRTRKGGGDWDYYSFINFCKKAKIAHPMIIEHGYHLDFAENYDRYMSEVVAYYNDISAMLGITAPPVTPPAEPEQPEPPTGYFEYTYAKGDYLGTIGKRFGVKWQDIKRKDGKPLDDKNMHIGDVLLIPGEGPTYFTTTDTCYTLYAVGRRYDVDWQTIRLANGATPNPKAMRPGMVLWVK
jgi:LysM repeat protein